MVGKAYPVSNLMAHLLCQKCGSTFAHSLERAILISYDYDVTRKPRNPGTYPCDSANGCVISCLQKHKRDYGSVFYVCQVKVVFHVFEQILGDWVVFARVSENVPLHVPFGFSEASGSVCQRKRIIKGLY